MSDISEGYDEAIEAGSFGKDPNSVNVDGYDEYEAVEFSEADEEDAREEERQSEMGRIYLQHPYMRLPNLIRKPDKFCERIIPKETKLLIEYYFQQKDSYLADMSNDFALLKQEQYAMLIDFIVKSQSIAPLYEVNISPADDLRFKLINYICDDLSKLSSERKRLTPKCQCFADSYQSVSQLYANKYLKRGLMDYYSWNSFIDNVIKPKVFDAANVADDYKRLTNLTPAEQQEYVQQQLMHFLNGMEFCWPEKPEKEQAPEPNLSENDEIEF